MPASSRLVREYSWHHGLPCRKPLIIHPPGFCKMISHMSRQCYLDRLHQDLSREAGDGGPDEG
jgi:hypothetical protein